MRICVVTDMEGLAGVSDWEQCYATDDHAPAYLEGLAQLAADGLTRSKVRSKEAVHVYKREACRACDTPVARWDLAGRWAYACPTCQR